MTISVRAFAKINLGLRIGALRDDGFHELLTVYQTIGLHDVIGVSLGEVVGLKFGAPTLEFRMMSRIPAIGLLRRRCRL